MSPGAERIVLPAGVVVFALVASVILVMLYRTARKLARIRKNLEERGRELRRICESQSSEGDVDAGDCR